MHLYLKNQSPNTFGSKDIAQIKVFQNLGQSSRSRSQGQKSRYQKKFLKTRSKFKIKVTRSKVLVQNERALHEVSICEISYSNPPWFKSYSLYRLSLSMRCDADIDTLVMTIAQYSYPGELKSYTKHAYLALFLNNILSSLSTKQNISLK
jgi:hypothetical protein